jgi:hypothetical protein
MYLGDRFGRADNWSLISWNRWAIGARWNVTLPILITIAYITSSSSRETQSRA